MIPISGTAAGGSLLCAESLVYNRCGTKLWCLQAVTRCKRQQNIWEILGLFAVHLYEIGKKKSEKELQTLCELHIPLASGHLETTLRSPVALLEGDFSNKEPAKKHLAVSVQHMRPLLRDRLIIILLLALIFLFHSLSRRKAAYKYSNRWRGDVPPLRD